MEYLKKLIHANKIRYKYHVNVFFQCADMIYPQYNQHGTLINDHEAGKIHAAHGYFPPHIYAMFDCWPAVIHALKYAMPNLKIRCFAVSHDMLTRNQQGVTGYDNPIQLLKPKAFQDTFFIDQHPDYFSISKHWDIKCEQHFVPATHNSLVYAAPSSTYETMTHQGETRIYIMGGKILPVGIQIHAKKSHPIILDQAHFNVAKTFIDHMHPKLNCFYYGLDIIKQTQPDGTDHCSVIKAHDTVMDFLPQISEIIKSQYADIKQHIQNLPDIYQHYITLNYLDILVYRPLYENLFRKKTQIEKNRA